MSKKEQCKALMLKFFGEASAKIVDRMDETSVVETCRAKVRGFLGEICAKEFDKIH